MKKNTRKARILNFFANNPGEHKTSEIARAVGLSVNNTSPVLGQLARDGKIRKIKGGTYRGIDTQTQSPDDKLKQISEKLRTAVDNEVTISELLNAYDVMQRDTINDLLDNIREGIDLEQRAFYLDTLKVLALVVDRLMKRWSLVHVGYDTNTRQAQEDAKAKTEERQKEALKDAPIEEQVSVIGSFDLETKELIDNFPTLENLTDEEAEEIKV